MSRSRAAALTAALGLVLGASACAGSGQAPPSTPTATAIATASVPSASPSVSAPAPVGTSDAENTAEPMEELEEDSGAPESVPVWDEAAREEAAARAVGFMTAFGRPTLPADRWLVGIQGLMAPEARDWFAYVDPANVPVTAVTGPADVRDVGSAYLAEVLVPTDAGPYLVTLSRRTGTEPFLVTGAAPVE